MSLLRVLFNLLNLLCVVLLFLGRVLLKVAKALLTCFIIVFVLIVAKDILKTLYPLAMVNVKDVPANEFIKPYWPRACKMHLLVYLSTQSQFNATTFIQQAGYRKHQPYQHSFTNAALLLEDEINTPSFSRSLMISSIASKGSKKQLDDDDQDNEASYFNAVAEWLGHRKEEDENDSMIIVDIRDLLVKDATLGGFYKIYQLLSDSISTFFTPKLLDDLAENPDNAPKETVYIPQESLIWSSLASNSSVYLHALVIRTGSSRILNWPPDNDEEAVYAIERASRSLSMVLADQVDLTQYNEPFPIDTPPPIHKPKRYLIFDVLNLFRKNSKKNATTQQAADSKVENMDAASQESSLHLQNDHYWIPRVAIKYVNEETNYPAAMANLSGMPLIKVGETALHPNGTAMMPVLYAYVKKDYFSLLHNVTKRVLPLRITFDRHDLKNKLASASLARHRHKPDPWSPAKWRLMSTAIKFVTAGDDTSPYFLRFAGDVDITKLAILALLISLGLYVNFLALKSEVTFWRKHKDSTGISVQSLLISTCVHAIALAFKLLNMHTLYANPRDFIVLAINFSWFAWRCQRAAGLIIVRKANNSGKIAGWWNWIPSLFGFEFKATLIDIAPEGAKRLSHPERLRLLSLESDREITRSFFSFLLPLFVGPAVFSLLCEQHSGWYWWASTVTFLAVHDVLLVLMVPQILLNRKLRRANHLPWRAWVYGYVGGTLIEHSTLVLIGAPLMVQGSCITSHATFWVLVFQRWLYSHGQSPIIIDRERELLKSSEAKKTQ